MDPRIPASSIPPQALRRATRAMGVFASLLTLVGLVAAPEIGAFASPAIVDGGSSSLDSGPGGNGSSSLGSPKPWLGGMAGLNLATGNKLTTIPLTGWTARGGMPVGFALFHNSGGNQGSSIAPCWNVSYESQVSFDNSGNATLVWDDGSTVTFTKNGSGFTAPPGEHGTFSQTSTSPALYEYVSTGQTHYVFHGSFGLYLTRIYDLNGNAISINRPSGNPFLISAVVDPTGRTLIYTWSGTTLQSIGDPLGRQWTFNYSSAPQKIGIMWEPYDSADNLPGYWTEAYDSLLLQSVTLPAPSSPYTSALPTIGFTYSQTTYQKITYYTGTIQSVTDPKGNVATWSYDPNSPSVITGATDPMGLSTTISYSNSTTAGTGSTTVTDANNHSTTQNYVGGTLHDTLDATNTAVGPYVFDANNNLTQLTDGRGKIWKYGFDASGTNRISATDPDSDLTTTQFNALNEPTLVTDALGHAMTLQYDTAGNLRSATDPMSHTSSVTIPSGAFGLPSSAQDPLGNVTTFNTYDSNGNLTQVTDPNGVTGYVTYNTLGWKTSATDALGNTTVWAYDNWGRVTQVKKGGAQQQAFYRVDGAPGCLNGGAGTSDDENRIFTADTNFLSSLLAGGWQAQGTFGYVYPAANSPTNVPGATLIALYRLQSASPAGQSYYTTSTANVSYFVGLGWTDEGVIGYVFPPNTSNTAGLVPLYGAWNSTTNRNFFTTGYWEYTNLAAPWQKQGIVCYLQGQAGSLQTVATYTYDLDGNVLTTQDANGNGVAATYDADNRILMRMNTRGNGGHGTNDTVLYTYDTSNPFTGNPQKGLLYSMVNGNNATTYYSYDALNRPVMTKLPDSTVSQITGFDGNGNVTQTLDANGIAHQITYDNENRVIATGYPSGQWTSTSLISPTEIYTYYADGHPKSMTDPSGTSYWTFDPAGRLTQFANPNGNTVNYGYDNDSRLTTKSVPGIGTWSYTYGLYYGATTGTYLAGMTTPYGETTLIYHDGAGRLNQRILGNNVDEFYSYDDQSRLTDIVALPSSALDPIAEFHYGYDVGGRVTSLRRGKDGQLSQFTYDGANQLVEQNMTSAGGKPWYDETFSYDHNGNRLTRTLSGCNPDVFTYDAGDKLLTVSGGPLGNRTYTYDHSGAITQVLVNGSPTENVTWDWHGRALGFAPTNGGAATNNLYNGMGLRVQKTDGGGTFNLITDGAGPGSPVLSDGAAVYSDGLSERRGGTSKFYTADILGSTSELTDSSGSAAVDFHNEYDAFGNLTYHYGDNTPTPFQFAGRQGYQTDASSGLMLLGHRFYDPSIGRFISRDPAGAGDNWYAYCANNPVSNGDPLGLDREDFSMPGNTSDTDMEQEALKHGWQEGDSLQVKNADGSIVNLQIPFSQGSGWGYALGILGDFLTGTGPTVRHYGPNSLQSQQMKNSQAAHLIYIQIALKNFPLKTSGYVGTVEGFLSTARDGFLNGTETQVGGFGWSFSTVAGSSEGTVTIYNTLSANSFLYETFSINNWINNHVGLPSGETGSFDRQPGVGDVMGNIDQTFQYEVHVPDGHR